MDCECVKRVADTWLFSFMHKHYLHGAECVQNSSILIDKISGYENQFRPQQFRTQSQ